MDSKRLQYYVHTIGLILLFISATLKIVFQYQVTRLLSYLIEGIALVYLYLLYKNRYE